MGAQVPGQVVTGWAARGSGPGLAFAVHRPGGPRVLIRAAGRSLGAVAGTSEFVACGWLIRVIVIGGHGSASPRHRDAAPAGAVAGVARLVVAGPAIRPRSLIAWSQDRHRQANDRPYRTAVSVQGLPAA